MKTRLLAATALAITIGSTAAHAQSFAGGPPTSARPGECYARVVRPAEYDAVPETVVTREAYEENQAVQAQFAPSSMQVMTREAGIRYDVRQPRWEARTETVVVRPEYERLTVVPARFETRTETVTVGEPRMVWKRGANLSSVRRVDAQTGEVWCLVEEPAATQQVARRIMVSPERIERVTVPAETRTVTRQVMVDRGGVAETATPAEYRALPTQELTRPASISTRQVAQETGTIERLRLRSAERQDWVQVLCDTNATVDRVVKLQTALAQRGYYRGRIDGVSGPATQRAVEAFERANNLPHTGGVSMEAMRMLGVDGAMQPTMGLPSTQAAPAPASPPANTELEGRRGPAAETNSNSVYMDREVGRRPDQLDGGPSAGSAPSAMAAPAPTVSVTREYSVRRRLNWGQ
jgi:peptidoglycan hydrolase-like protein with peptidoglycan-binding domain